MRLLAIPLLFILVSAAVAFVLGDLDAVPASFAEAVAWLRGHGDWLWLAASAVIIGDFLLPLPSTPALVSLGMVYGPFWGGLIGGIATAVSGLLAFGVTRAIGRRGALFLVGERDLQRAEHFYARWGVSAVVIGRAVGGPLEWLVLIAGISGMPWMRATIALLLGGCASAFATAWLGHVAVDRPILAVALVVAWALAFALIGRWLLPPAREAADTSPDAKIAASLIPEGD